MTKGDKESLEYFKDPLVMFTIFGLCVVAILIGLMYYGYIDLATFIESFMMIQF